tara:strand:+ start:125 stop:973 length:849 start_codon:yes stop_codon:yes gene_type:complete
MIFKKQKISVIIPSYNEEDNIEKCLKTILNQTYENYEVIVIDDSSTDKTVKIIESFKKVKLLKQNHLGPGIARNLGAKSSEGEILIFVDADMEFPRDYLQKLVEPILEGVTWGTIHSKEEIANKNNLWARCWGPVVPLDKDGKGLIFRAITKKKFLEYGMFDPKEGYADDQSIMKKSGVKSYPSKAWCYHNNPDSLKEVFLQGRWIGRSYRFKLLDFPILNLFAAIMIYLLFYPLMFFKAAKCAVREKKIVYFFYYLIFGLVVYNSKFVGMLERIIGRKRIK